MARATRGVSVAAVAPPVSFAERRWADIRKLRRAHGRTPGRLKAFVTVATTNGSRSSGGCDEQRIWGWAQFVDPLDTAIHQLTQVCMYTDLITTVPAPKHTQHTAFHTQLSTHSHILSVPRARPGSKHKAARVFTRSRPQSGSTSRTEIAYALGQRDGFLLHPLAGQLVRCVEHGACRTRSRWCALSLIHI